MKLTPEAAERLSAWRTEIAGELEAARKAVAPLSAEHERALAAARDAESSHRELQQILDPAFARLTSPLAQRVAWLRSAADEAKAQASRAKHALEQARAGVDELERALRQLDHLLASEEAQEAA